MCTRTIQKETEKRRNIENALRPLADAVWHNEDARVLELAYALVRDLGYRSCCITLPTEPHGSQGRGCILR